MKNKKKPGNKAIRLACWILIGVSILWIAAWWLGGVFVTLRGATICCWVGENGTQDPSVNPVSYTIQTTPVTIMFFFLILLASSYLGIKELWKNL